MLRRLDGWPSKLHAFIRERRNMPYEYGVNDCFWFAHGAILAMTSVDIMPGVVPPTSRIAAAKYLLSQGYGDVEDLVTIKLGAPLASTRLAGRGDVVSFTTEQDAHRERHLAVVDGVGAITPGRDRLRWVPRVLWRAGWRV
jgi:hypothetical protein